MKITITLFYSLLMACSTIVFAQRSTGINNPNPNNKAAFDIKTTAGFKQGFIMPRLTTADTNNIGVTVGKDRGLMFFDTLVGDFRYWDGNKWKGGGGASSTGNYWQTIGNTLVAADTGITGFKYLGTNSDFPLIFATNGVQRMRISKSGNVAIGKTPSGGIPLQVKSNGTGAVFHIEQSANTQPLFEFRQNPNKNAKQLLYDNANNPVIQLSTDPLDGSYINAGNLGIGNTSPSVSLDLSSRTDAIALPVGKTSEQPASAFKGMIRYNSEKSWFEGHDGTSWNAFGTGTGDVLGTGSTNTIPYWISTKQLGFSTLQTDGTTFGIGVPQLNTVTFRISSSLATAFQAINTNATGEAVYGLSNSASGGVGVHGFASGGRGIYGQAASAIGIGGYFEHSSATGTALATGVGRVGIGTSSPSTLLHVFNPSGNAILNLDAPSVNAKGIAFSNAGTAAWSIETIPASGNLAFGNAAFGGYPILIANSSGFLGLGVATPLDALHIGTGKQIRVDALAGIGKGIVTVNTNGVLGRLSGTSTDVVLGDGTLGTITSSQWTTSGSNIYYNTGNVGIGTTTPTDPLTIKVSGTKGIALIGTVSQDLYVGFDVSSNLLFSSSNPIEFLANGGGVVFHLDDGDAIMQVPLTVNSNVKIPAANDYTYLTAKTKYQQIPVTALKAIKNTYDFVLTTYVAGQDGENAYGSIIGGTAGTKGVATAPVYLPDGATITNFEAKLFDTDATVGRNITVSLARTTFGSINTDLMVSVATTDADNVATGAMVTRTNSTIASAVINNNTYAYYIKVESYQANTNMGIGKIRITYTVTKAD